VSVYAAREVQPQPSEEGLGLHLTRGPRVPVFFSWDGEVPWIRQVALPDGGRTPVRVIKNDGVGAGFSVEAADASIPGMPHVAVLPLSEVVRAFSAAAPVTDAVLPAVAPGVMRCARGRLASWERLCVWLAEGGAPPRCTPKTWSTATNSGRRSSAFPVVCDTRSLRRCGNWTAATVR
jgi:hypothetical protein